MTSTLAALVIVALVLALLGLARVLHASGAASRDARRRNPRYLPGEWQHDPHEWTRPRQDQRR